LSLLLPLHNIKILLASNKLGTSMPIEEFGRILSLIFQCSFL
jgi:hypothetical protein